MERASADCTSVASRMGSKVILLVAATSGHPPCPVFEPLVSRRHQSAACATHDTDLALLRFAWSSNMVEGQLQRCSPLAILDVRPTRFCLSIRSSSSYLLSAIELLTHELGSGNAVITGRHELSENQRFKNLRVVVAQSHARSQPIRIGAAATQWRSIDCDSSTAHWQSTPVWPFQLTSPTPIRRGRWS